MFHVGRRNTAEVLSCPKIGGTRAIRHPGMGSIDRDPRPFARASRLLERIMSRECPRTPPFPDFHVDFTSFRYIW